MKMLVIEDEPDLRESLKDFLHKQGYLCETAANFAAADDKIAVYQYDIIILDIGLPDGNGLDLLTVISQLHPETGVLIVSAKDALDDKIAGLDLGADDYITKPFHLAELNSRIHALRRRKNLGGQHVIQFNEIAIHPAARTCIVHNEQIELTGKEFDLLLYLLINRNRVLSKEAIAEHLLGEEADLMEDFDFIYTHIKNLRRKIAKAGGGDYLRSVYGAGYKWVDA